VVANGGTMDKDSITLSREVLYGQVWSEPMRTLSKRYGLSDVGLAKICKRLGIPVPERGYWAKKAVGKAHKPRLLKPLPAGSSPESREVVIGLRKPGIVVVDSSPLKAQVEFEARPENVVAVPVRLVSPHRLVRLTVQALKPSRDHLPGQLVSNWREPHLDIEVTKPLLDRALRIMDALVKACEARGWPVSLGELKADDRKSYVTVLEQRIPFGIREKLQKVRNELKHDWDPAFSSLPSGRLSVVIRQTWGHSVDKSWDEDGRMSLESRLNEFVVGLVRKAVIQIEQVRQRELQKLQYVEEQRSRSERLRLREEEEARRRDLLRQASQWAERKSILAYLEEVRKAATQAGVLTAGSALLQWLGWADPYTASLDPIAGLISKAQGTQPNEESRNSL
jgi:hypothetical protein